MNDGRPGGLVVFDVNEDVLRRGNLEKAGWMVLNTLMPLSLRREWRLHGGPDLQQVRAGDRAGMGRGYL